MEVNKILHVTEDSVKTIIKKFLSEEDNDKRLEIFLNYKSISLFKESVDNFLDVILDDTFKDIINENLFDFIANYEDKFYTSNVNISTNDLAKLIIIIERTVDSGKIIDEIEKFVDEHNIYDDQSIIINKVIRYANLGELESIISDYFNDDKLKDSIEIESEEAVKIKNMTLEEVREMDLSTISTNTLEYFTNKNSTDSGLTHKVWMLLINEISDREIVEIEKDEDEEVDIAS